ncbi:MAG: DUF5009 domain-containing protein [Candidatus Sumerlaeia bacterium]|nr:DUF5009 domain-containing protein [Candidatus Sumerlaeia bacterium]
MAEATSPRRSLSLDALRGLAILMMCLSGVVPWIGLPNWMYHAQFPRFMDGEAVSQVRFDGTFPGYTWVDLVFPMFLFAMGAAFPFALGSRIAKGVAMWRIIAGVFLRGFALVLFAMYVQHITPHQINSPPTTNTWLLGLLGFALLFPVYTRFPASVPRQAVMAIRLLGIGAMVGFMLYLNWPAEAESLGQRLQQLYRSVTSKYDIILLVLANVAVFGSLIWIATRDNLELRLAFLGLGVVVHYSQGSSMVPWLFNAAFLKYLMIVIPGTIVGDVLFRWMRASGEEREIAAMSRGNLHLLALLSLAGVVMVHVVLQGRWVYTGGLVCAAILAPAWLLLKRAGGADGSFMRSLYIWSVIWLVLGFLVEPLQGGIKKDSSTMSYYLVSTGLSILVLLSLFIWIDLFKYRWGFNLLITNGQNPMLAYVGIRNLLAPIVNLPLISVEGAWKSLDAIFFGLSENPWIKAIWSFAKTVGLAIVVMIFTRLKIVWRT